MPNSPNRTGVSLDVYLPASMADDLDKWAEKHGVDREPAVNVLLRRALDVEGCDCHDDDAAQPEHAVQEPGPA